MLDGNTLTTPVPSIFSVESAFNEYCKQMYHSGKKEFGPCAECGEMISLREVGNNDVALELSQDPRIWHRECCPCQLNEGQKYLNQNKLWQELDVRFHDKTDTRGSLYDYHFIGGLDRCPFCFRIFDSDGTEVKP